jgi:hypothetical protein
VRHWLPPAIPVLGKGLFEHREVIPVVHKSRARGGAEIRRIADVDQFQRPAELDCCGRVRRDTRPPQRTGECRAVVQEAGGVLS